MADATALPKFSISILLTMLLILAASSAVLWALTSRETERRIWIRLRDWANRNGFAARPEQTSPWLQRYFEPTLPPPLNQLEGPPHMVYWLGDKGWLEAGFGRTVLVKLRWEAKADDPRPREMNLLVRRLPLAWPVTGLRPAHLQASLLDHFPLTSYPDLTGRERFTLFGAEEAAARALGRSSIDALLPADVGLLLHGTSLVLDFSARHFDPLELSRQIALADQLIANLPTDVPVT